MRWHLLLSPPHGGAENMALDEALMARARATGEAVLRVYGWATPTLSFGRHQTARGRYDRGRIEALGLAVVRRPTGGRSILHHREVTYSVTAPVAGLGSLRESYVRINRLLLHGLATLGVRVLVSAGDGRSPRPTEAPCFEVPVAGELMIDGRKLAGSAQWREDGALLQHGSILVEDDQRALAGLLVSSAPAPLAPATLREALGRPPAVNEVAEALFASARLLEDPDADTLSIDAMLAAAMRRALVHYRNDDWTWRR
jgi:lipoate-protein ligase A